MEPQNETDVSPGVLFAVQSVAPVLQLVFGALAILTHALVVAITVRTKTMRTSCNLLIAFDSACSALAQWSLFVSYVANTLLKVKMPVGVCYLLRIPSSFSIAAVAMASLLLALDRLLAVIAPIWTMQANQKRVALFFIGVSLLTAAVVETPYTLSVARDPGVPALCTGNLEYTPQVIPIDSWYNYVNFVGSLGAYAALYGVLRWREAKAKAANKAPLTAVSTSRLIFPSLCGIVVVNAIAWTLPTTLGFLCSIIQPSTDTRFFLMNFMGKFATLGTALVPVVLFTLSKEYKMGLRKLLPSFRQQQQSFSFSSPVVSLQQQQNQKQNNGNGKGNRNLAIIK